MPRPRKTPAQPATPATPARMIRIDLDGLTIGDLKIFAALKSGQVDELALVELLGRCVVGGVDHLPLTALPEVAQALASAIAAAQNPKT